MYPQSTRTLARRLQSTGGSLAVTLPKQWVMVLGLKRGDTLLIEVKPDSLILTTPGREETVSRISIPYPAKQVELLLNDLTAAYLFGYDIIEITGSVEVEPLHREMIRAAARRLLGLELIEEDTSRVQMQVLADHLRLNPEQIFRRMHIISKGMLADSLASLAVGDKELARLVRDRDEELDRFYFFMVRLLRRAASDPLLSSQYELSPVELLDMRIAAHALENLGDTAVEMCEAFEINPNLFSSKVKGSLERASALLQESQEKAVRAFLKKEGREAIEVFRNFESLVSLLQPMLEEVPLRRELLTAHRALTRAARLLVDIADLAAPLHA